MKLRLHFGIPPKKIRHVTYHAQFIEDFPQLVLFEGEAYEHVQTAKSQIMGDDYVVHYKSVQGEDLTGRPIVNLTEMHRYLSFEAQCGCGAVYQRGFENTHSSWCPRWEKI